MAYVKTGDEVNIHYNGETHDNTPAACWWGITGYPHKVVEVLSDGGARRVAIIETTRGNGRYAVPVTNLSVKPKSVVLDFTNCGYSSEICLAERLFNAMDDGKKVTHTGYGTYAIEG